MLLYGLCCQNQVINLIVRYFRLGYIEETNSVIVVLSLSWVLEHESVVCTNSMDQEYIMLDSKVMTGISP